MQNWTQSDPLIALSFLDIINKIQSYMTQLVLNKHSMLSYSKMHSYNMIKQMFVYLSCLLRIYVHLNICIRSVHMKMNYFLHRFQNRLFIFQYDWHEKTGFLFSDAASRECKKLVHVVSVDFSYINITSLYSFVVDGFSIVMKHNLMDDTL